MGQTAEQRRDILWPAESETIAAIANQPTPLNDRFAEGHLVHDGEVVRYICALERRVAALEQRAYWR